MRPSQGGSSPARPASLQSPVSTRGRGTTVSQHPQRKPLALVTGASAGIGAERIRAIVEDLRLLSSFQDTPSEPISVIRAIRVATRMSQHQLRNRAHLIEEFDDVPTVMGNEARLTQVLINLIVNAIHAMPDRPKTENEVCLRLFSIDDAVAIEVIDNGEGIPEEDLEHIFEPFFTTKPTGQGSGLGLALSRDIIDSFGGTLGVESRIHVGTRFRIELPRQRNHS